MLADIPEQLSIAVGLTTALEAGVLRGLARHEVGASAATHAGDLAVDGLAVLVAAAVVQE